MNILTIHSEGESQVSAKKNAIAAIVVVPSSVPDKARVIQQKLDQANANGQKPSVNAIAQGFRPSHQSLTNTVQINSHPIVFL